MRGNENTRSRVVYDDALEALGKISIGRNKGSEIEKVCGCPRAEFPRVCQVSFIEWCVPRPPEQISSADVARELGDVPIIPQDLIACAVVLDDGAARDGLVDAHRSTEGPAIAGCGATLCGEVECGKALGACNGRPEDGDDQARVSGEIHRGRNVRQGRCAGGLLLGGRAPWSGRY